MTKNIKGVITVLVVAAAAFAAWHFTHQNAKSYARLIAKNTSATYLTLLTFDEGYLKSWASAIKKSSQTFIYNSETYDTLTGKKK